MKSDTVHIGVDVSKEKLDVFVPALREGMRPTAKEVDNSVAGITCELRPALLRQHRHQAALHATSIPSTPLK